ncbi:MAG: molecular chaperone HscC [Novosphingobium sp. 28-62-57]|uniref:Hsp70 family protein n=1 Tax=unclassified Novosphingobium TaxID=2644732 RepID=UPI000BC8843D|nr:MULTISPECIES: molecular chaperone HscC [unclassified Novosphingobium]OYW48308.1 MAG: molecular chaperone HscC [Novosphingobium sp. 12-62-10]OYZ11764.1 MAG: molecular chaperone HscC [Novosphingobium sp. 28-62-57]OZA36577.1 MAG: molecular chaperone HscC [Novosphingobium sp. 17-62-9]HQS69361.1 molecular chaperone HscC [Novosphingobium sp.]
MLIGIDLGTTNSAVALWQNSENGGEAVLVPNALGGLLTPSAVSVLPDGNTLVGAAALERMAMKDGATATSFKRLMGTDRKLKLGRKEFSAEELSALVLMSLRDDVTAHTGTCPTEAVITVPAYFNDRQRKATRRAGELAGLTVRRLINEPTAAALAFGLQDKEEREPFLVFDLGGGTFDVSIVEMFEGIVEVRASAGDNRLGGDDFNSAIATAVRGRLDPDGLLGKIDERRTEALLLQAAERTKRALSDAQEAEFALTVDGTRLSTTVTASEFEAQAEGLIKRLRDPVVRALRDSQIDAASLSEVVLVGGATRMPLVRKAITRLFGRFPNSTIHPDHAVALGAAIQGGLIARDGGLEEIRITDVCPFTLGIETAEHSTRGTVQEGLFSPIIERNTPVPVSRSGVYSTMGEKQKQITVRIYQGEAREVSGNVFLGELKVPVPPRPAGEVAIDVRFSYDSSGLLEVDVEVPLTGTKHNLMIIDEEDRKAAKDLDARRKALAALKHHPREEATNQMLLARAERCYEEFLGDVRAVVGDRTSQFVAALDSQDPRRIADAAADLSGLLDMLEAHPPL